MTNSLLISISDKENYLKVLVSKNIYYRNLVHKDNLIYLVINESDLDILKKEFLSLNVVKYYGKKRIKYFLKGHYIFILSFLFSYIVLVILSNVIFDVEVVTNDNKLKDKIYLYLKDYGIEKYKFVKKSSDLDNIKEKILKDNKDDLEWIEITRSGTKYTVNLTERIINNEVENNKVSDIVAKKDALITHLTIRRGNALKEVNELVHKGEVIITFFVFIIHTLLSFESVSTDMSSKLDKLSYSCKDVVAVFLPSNTSFTNLSVSVPNVHLSSLFNKTSIVSLLPNVSVPIYSCTFSKLHF